MHGVDKLKISLKDISRTACSLEFSVGDAFFSELDQDEILGGEVKVNMVVREVAGEIFRLNFSFSGVVRVLCDRCLEEMETMVEGEDSLRLCYEDNELAAEVADSDVVMISPRATEYNYAWELYEMIALALPMQRVHRPEDCNSEMLEQIKMEEVEDEDAESDEY